MLIRVDQRVKNVMCYMNGICNNNDIHDIRDLNGLVDVIPDSK